MQVKEWAESDAAKLRVESLNIEQFQKYQEEITQQLSHLRISGKDSVLGESVQDLAAIAGNSDNENLPGDDK